jgi:hypothetical protein
MGNSTPPPRPLSLHIAAWLFIVMGALAWLQFFMQLAQQRFMLNTNLLFPILGLGLLFLKAWARTLTIFVSGLGAVLTVFGVADALLGFQLLTMTLGGRRMYLSEAPGIAVAMCVFGFLIAVWIIRTLLRNDVSLLFGDRFHLQPLEKRPRIDEARAETDPV